MKYNPKFPEVFWISSRSAQKIACSLRTFEMFCPPELTLSATFGMVNRMMSSNLRRCGRLEAVMQTCNQCCTQTQNLVGISIFLISLPFGAGERKKSLRQGRNRGGGCRLRGRGQTSNHLPVVGNAPVPVCSWCAHHCLVSELLWRLQVCNVTKLVILLLFGS